MTLAEITPDVLTPLINTGVVGAVLWWLMIKVEGRLKANENATNRLSRAMLLLVVSLKSANDAAKTEAQSIIKEVDVSDGKGGE